MITDMKIGTRLGFGFGLILLLLTVLGIMGLNGMGKINQDFEHILSVTYTKIKLANDVDEKVGSLIEAIELMQLKDQAGRVAAKHEIEELRAEYKELVGKLEKLEINDQGKELIAAAKTSLENAKEANNEVIELSLANKSKEALEIFNKQAFSLDMKIKTAFKAIIHYEEGRMELRVGEARKQFINSQIISQLSHLLI
jgi:methyl-accepting chemotaxis protein